MTAPRRSDRPRFRLFLVLTVVMVGAAACGDLEPTQQGGAPNDLATVPWGGDILGAGSTVAVSEAVPGDVLLAGGTLQFSGTVDGSYLGAGGEQEIGGRVANSVRAAGGTIRLRSSVGRNVTVAGREIFLEEGAVVGRNAYLAGGTLGDRLLNGTRSNLRRARVTGFLVGGFLVATLGFVPVVGLLFKVLVAIVGVGAGAMALRSAAFPEIPPPAEA